jgi:hypothetical protein
MSEREKQKRVGEGEGGSEGKGGRLLAQCECGRACACGLCVSLPEFGDVEFASSVVHLALRVEHSKAAGFCFLFPLLLLFIWRRLRVRSCL